MRNRSDNRQEAAPAGGIQSNQYIHQPTKLERVLAHLIEVGNISPREAMDQYQCWRLSAVIHTLKKAGIHIETHQESHEGGTHARYVMSEQSVAVKHLSAIQARRVS